MKNESRGDGWLKLIVLVIGAPFTFLTLMTLASTFTANVWIQVSSPISPGNSGGPIFDQHGVVIGVSTRVATTEFRAQNLNLAIPLATSKRSSIARPPSMRPFSSGVAARNRWDHGEADLRAVFRGRCRLVRVCSLSDCACWPEMRMHVGDGSARLGFQAPR